MHGTLQVTPESSALSGRMVLDPVCGMTIDSAAAAASETFNGKPVYFCSEGCRRRFLANPAAYTPALAAPGAVSSHSCCSQASDGHRHGLNPRALTMAAGAGVLASALILGFYFGTLTLVSGWPYTVEQFSDWWPYIVALAVGFGTQIGLWIHLRRALHETASGKVVAATGTTSGLAMVACCSHYLVNLLSVLGATGLVTFVGMYQVELFWFGIVSNLAGLAYIGRRIVSFAHGART